MAKDKLSLVVPQFNNVQSRYPDLALVSYDQVVAVEGSIWFEVEHDGRLCDARYGIRLVIPADYPSSPPIAFETEGEIPRDYGHFLDAGNLCLGAPVEVRRRFARDRTLLGFIEDQVVPYLFRYAYLTRYGDPPFADLPHGHHGLMQYYLDFFKTTDVWTMLKLLKCLADGPAPPLSACPCRSKRSLKECHGPMLDDLRPHLPPGHFAKELRAIGEVARRTGIAVSEEAVLTKRAMKRRRNGGSSRRRRRRRPV